MRNLIVSSLVSLDGIHGDPQSWVGDYFDQQAAEESLAVLLDSDAMLMGRNTYDYFAPRWSSPSGPYLERICQMRKYVFSSTLTAADWNNTTIIPGDPVAAARELKQQGDRHLVIYGDAGSPKLCSSTACSTSSTSSSTRSWRAAAPRCSAPVSARTCAWSPPPSATTAWLPCPIQTPEGRRAE